MELTRQQERQLDKMLEQRGIDKQRFLRDQAERHLENLIEKQKLRHECVLRPRDPVTGLPAVKSRGPYGPHFSKRRWQKLWLRRRMWIEEPMPVRLLRGTRHEHIQDGSRCSTMWASGEV